MAAADQAKILACLKSIEMFGLDSPRVEFRQISGKLWEIKIQSSSGSYRIFYVALKKEILVLLHAYHKKTAKAPKKELVIAERRMSEVIKDETFYFNICYT